MEIFFWIVGGLTGLLLALSGVCWAIFIAMDSPDWHKLGVRIFRWAKSLALLLFNVWIWGRVVGTIINW